MIRGGGGVSQKVIFDDQGGESRIPLKSMTSLMNSPLGNGVLSHQNPYIFVMIIFMIV